MSRKKDDDIDSLKENETEHEDETENSEQNSGSVVVSDKVRPAKVAVIPVYDRPVLPSELIPVQLASKWAATIRQVVNSESKVLAIVVRPESELEQEFKADSLTGKMGCLVRIMQARIGEDLQIVIQGLTRVRLDNIHVKNSKVIEGDATYPEDELPPRDAKEEIEVKAYAMAIISTMQEMIPINPLYYQELKQYLLRFNPNDPSLLADCAASITTASSAELLEVLETVDLIPRLKLSLSLVQKELASTKLEKTIKNTVSEKINAKQRNFFLKEQLKEIQKELGVLVDDKTSEINRLTDKMDNLNPPKEILDRFHEELNRMKLLDSQSPEFAVSRDYLNWLTDVPWGVYVKDNFNIRHARKILEEDHEGLNDVKERILEFLAVGSYKQ